MFARWWAGQLKSNSRRITHPNGIWHIQEAINSRRVMINDNTGITDNTECLPYLIWWPLKPHEGCLQSLVKQCPKIKETIEIAFIMCDYPWLYRSLDLRPTNRLCLAAEQSGNTMYREDLQKRKDELGITTGNTHRDIDGRSDCIDGDLEPTNTIGQSPIGPHMMCNTLEGFGPYIIGDRASPNIIDKHVWISPSVLRKFDELFGPGGREGDLEWVEEERKASRGVDEAISISTP